MVEMAGAFLVGLVQIFHGTTFGLMLLGILIGFVVGICGMYWYIHNGEEVMSNAGSWMEKSASAYRDDKAHELVDQQTGSPATRR